MYTASLAPGLQVFLQNGFCFLGLSSQGHTASSQSPGNLGRGPCRSPIINVHLEARGVHLTFLSAQWGSQSALLRQTVSDTLRGQMSQPHPGQTPAFLLPCALSKASSRMEAGRAALLRLRWPSWSFPLGLVPSSLSTVPLSFCF